MKSILLSFAFVMALAPLAAQVAVPKGAVMLGGSAGFNVTSSGGDSDAQFQLSPNVAVFVANNLGVGASMSLLLADNYRLFGFGPYARYYVWTTLFAQGGFNFSSVKVGDFDSNSELGANLGLGYSIFLNSSVALEPLFVVQFGEDRTNVGLNIGVQAFLNRK